MAATTIGPDVKDEPISYEVIREEDVEQVLKLLKNTFFKVNILLLSHHQESCQLFDFPPTFPFLFRNLLNVLFRMNGGRMKGENCYIVSVAAPDKCHDVSSLTSLRTQKQQNT